MNTLLYVVIAGEGSVFHATNTEEDAEESRSIIEQLFAWNTRVEEHVVNDTSLYLVVIGEATTVLYVTYEGREAAEWIKKLRPHVFPLRLLRCILGKDGADHILLNLALHQKVRDAVERVITETNEEIGVELFTTESVLEDLFLRQRYSK